MKQNLQNYQKLLHLKDLKRTTTFYWNKKKKKKEEKLIKHNTRNNKIRKKLIIISRYRNNAKELKRHRTCPGVIGPKTTIVIGSGKLKNKKQ